MTKYQFIEGKKVVKNGTKVIKKRSIIMITKKGTIAFDMSMILLFAIEPETIKQIPRGGVSIPIARFVTIITP